MSETDENAARADVYAGDTATPSPSGDQAQAIYAYTIEADPDPDVLARVAALFNLANMAPLSADLRRTPAGLVVISLEIGPMPSLSAEMIRRKIAQLTCVTDAVLSERKSPV